MLAQRNRTPQENPFITTAEAAALTSIDESAFRLSRRTGHLMGRLAPAYYKVGTRKVVYKRQEILDWIEPTRVEPAPRVER